MHVVTKITEMALENVIQFPSFHLNEKSFTHSQHKSNAWFISISRMVLTLFRG